MPRRKKHSRSLGGRVGDVRIIAWKQGRCGGKLILRVGDAPVTVPFACQPDGRLDLDDAEGLVPLRVRDDLNRHCNNNCRDAQHKFQRPVTTSWRGCGCGKARR